ERSEIRGTAFSAKAKACATPPHPGFAIARRRRAQTRLRLNPGYMQRRKEICGPGIQYHDRRVSTRRRVAVKNFFALSRGPGWGVWSEIKKFSGMATRVFNAEYPSDHVPLLRWLIFTGVCVFAFVLAWHFGLVRMMVNGDRTYISIIIVVLYALSSMHCLMRTAAISRELDRAHRVLALVSKGVPQLKVDGGEVVTPEGTKLPHGEVTSHIRNLILKASLQGDERRVDQTLLLRGLADTLRGPNQLGAYAGDALMKLGLLGTIIGFIMMLAPI